MPRTANPELERRLVLAAIRLLDGGGVAAITMRAVAKEAGTTAPTLYQRFADRDALLREVIREAETQIVAHLFPKRSTIGFVSAYLDFMLEHSNRFELLADTFGARLALAHPTPVYDALKERLTCEIGITGRRREDLAMAIASLAIGTTRAMIAIGKHSPPAGEFRRCCLAALRLLLKSFSQ
jgi:AcrR family transcriptional regulator